MDGPQGCGYNIERWYVERPPRRSLAEAGWTLEFAVVV